MARRTPPPLRYEPVPEYVSQHTALDLSSSPSVGDLRPISPTDSLGEMEQQVFGHRITPSFHPNSLSFDPTSLDIHPSHPLYRSGDPNDTAFPPSPPRLPSQVDDDDLPPRQHGMQSVFFASPVPKPVVSRTRHKATAAPPAPAAAASDEEVEERIEFDVLVHVLPPPAKAPARGKKAAKVEPAKFGPFVANTEMVYDDLVQNLADAVESEVAMLIASSMEWRWTKPANSLFVPLRNEAGAISLTMKQVRKSAAKSSNSSFIIIQMQAPFKKPPPQNASDAGTSESVYNAAFGGADNYGSEDDPPSKKATFDEGLEIEIEKLADMYPPGRCAIHPTIACFHNRLNDLHFEMNRNRKIVWAAAIQRKTASLLIAPLGSNLFKAEAAIKKKKSATAPAADPPVLPSSPVPAPVTPMSAAHFPFFPGAYPNPYPYPPATPAYPPFPPMGYPYPSPTMYPSQMYETPRRHRRERERSWDGSSPPRQRRRTTSAREPDPPSSPAISGGSLDDFLDQHPALHADTKTFLEGLGFQIGDNLAEIPPKTWTDAGIPLFKWNKMALK
ncbi:hypothetical protein C8R47DRAFT_1313674 [Mycena vitilis]|nr:hypothetical protein C8R47DRAFT_1313674 [Mycena vitilis]